MQDINSNKFQKLLTLFYDYDTFIGELSLAISNICVIIL